MTSKSSVRQNFLDDTRLIKDYDEVSYLVAAVQLPTGAIELITNTTNIESKVQYYAMMYNEDFRLCANPNVKIVGYMIV